MRRRMRLGGRGSGGKVAGKILLRIGARGRRSGAELPGMRRTGATATAAQVPTRPIAARSASGAPLRRRPPRARAKAKGRKRKLEGGRTKPLRWWHSFVPKSCLTCSGWPRNS